MQVKSLLVQGNGAAVASHLASLQNNLEALVLFSLDADQPLLLEALRRNQVKCPVYLTETYGIIGYDVESGQNIELMEKGRGKEYGFCGGSGGRGCLVTGFSGGVQAGHTSNFPADASSLMVIADQSGQWATDSHKQAPVHFGGITKEAWRVIDNERLESVPYFWVANVDQDDPVGISAFTGDASQATTALMQSMPAGRTESGEVGLFPCYTRGVNKYGAENVETQAIVRAMSNNNMKPPRIYGMFAHGELGPSEFSGYTAEPNKIACEKHSMTSILSIHTKAGGLN